MSGLYAHYQWIHLPSCRIAAMCLAFTKLTNGLGVGVYVTFRCTEDLSKSSRKKRSEGFIRIKRSPSRWYENM